MPEVISAIRDAVWLSNSSILMSFSVLKVLPGDKPPAGLVISMTFFTVSRWCETELKLDCNGCFDVYMKNKYASMSEYFLTQCLDHEYDCVTPETADQP